MAVSLSEAQAEPHCPGNVNSLPLRLVQRSQIVVSITINHTGPYDFLVDTGAQVTTVDLALAAELHLGTQGTVGVTGVGVYAPAPLTQLESVDAGSHVVENVWRSFRTLDRHNWQTIGFVEFSPETFLSISICSLITRMKSYASMIQCKCGPR